MKESLFLREVAGLADDHDVSLGEVADKLEGKGMVFLALVCVLPFMQPIPLPGVSTLLGLVILLQGVGLMVARRPLLTKRMRELRLPPERVLQFVKGARKVYPWFGWMIRPRGRRLLKGRPVRVLAGLYLVLLAAFLSLPLPLPASNFIPALGIFLICLGLLEEDILILAIGALYATAFGQVLFFTFHLLWAELTESSWWPSYF